MLTDTANLVVLPFTASVLASNQQLTFAQVLTIQHNQIHIQRSYPGAPNAIGWTIFRRTARAYRYEGEPLFQGEKDAHRHIRKVYAIAHDLNDDILTTSNLHI